MPVVSRCVRLSPLLLAALVVPGVAGLCVGAALLSPLDQARLSWLTSVVCSGGTMVAARLIVRRLPARDPSRRFWWALAFAGASIGAGYALQLATAGDAVELTGVAQAFVTAPTSIVVAFMCVHPLQLTGRGRACFWLDMTTVMVGAAVYGWYFFDQPGGDLADRSWSVLTGPVVNLVAVFAVARLLVAGRAPFGPWTGVLGAAGAACGGLAIALAPSLLTQGRGQWLFALSAFGDVLLMCGAWLQWFAVDTDPRALQRGRRRPYSAVPYVALVATFALLAVALLGPGLDGRTWPVLAGAGASTALVVTRQLAAFSDNARLLHELDTRVDELHAALRERDALAARLSAMAFQDPLTGLGNRALFRRDLDGALAAGPAGRRVAVLVLDLDDFKPVNDRYGHAAGDEVLVEAGRRLRSALPDGTVTRLGGDEFAVVLCDPPEVLDELSVELAALIRRPCWTGTAWAEVGVSVGAAVGRCGETDAEALIRQADAAMYLNKGDGRLSGAGRRAGDAVRAAAAPPG